MRSILARDKLYRDRVSNAAIVLEGIAARPAAGVSVRARAPARQTTSLDKAIRETVVKPAPQRRESYRPHERSKNATGMCSENKSTVRKVVGAKKRWRDPIPQTRWGADDTSGRIILLFGNRPPHAARCSIELNATAVREPDHATLSRPCREFLDHGQQLITSEGLGQDPVGAQ
jgi:hypothetical protein